MKNLEYYVIGRAGDQAYPLIATQDEYEHTIDYILSEEFIDHPLKTYFEFCDPIPKNPVIGDYFSQTESIVSNKITNVLKPMNIEGIQLIPAEVLSDKGDIYDDYCYIHIYNRVKAVDRSQSVYREDKYDKDLLRINSFRLDEDVLKAIPLEKRLVFRLLEMSSIKLYHKSVVDAIMSVNPIGLKFIKVEDWSF